MIFLSNVLLLLGITSNDLKIAHSPCCGKSPTCIVDPALLEESVTTTGAFYLNASTFDKNSTRSTLREVARLTRLEEGNVYYRYAFDVDDDNLVLYTEKWVNKSALAYHKTLPHFRIWQEPYSLQIVGFINMVNEMHCLPNLDYVIGQTIDDV
jgi:quinol monooxygenase YgiN